MDYLYMDYIYIDLVYSSFFTDPVNIIEAEFLYNIEHYVDVGGDALAEGEVVGEGLSDISAFIGGSNNLESFDEVVEDSSGLGVLENDVHGCKYSTSPSLVKVQSEFSFQFNEGWVTFRNIKLFKEALVALKLQVFEDIFDLYLDFLLDQPFFWAHDDYGSLFCDFTPISVIGMDGFRELTYTTNRGIFFFLTNSPVREFYFNIFDLLNDDGLYVCDIDGNLNLSFF